MHGGTVAAFSEGEGKGAQFVLRFPLLRSWQSLGQLPWESFSPRLSNVAVLVVDDEAGHAALLKEILEGSGAVVTVASNAKEAFRHFQLNPPGVVLTDLAMPSEDGYSLLKQIRAEEIKAGLQKTPVAAVTAYASEREQLRLIEAGFNAFLAKPVEPAAVVRVVADLSRRSPGSERPVRS